MTDDIDPEWRLENIEALIDEYITRLRMGWIEDSPAGILEQALNEIRLELP